MIISAFFEEYEIEAILSELTFSEQFLEKYFSVLDKDKIARYQLFSERFYQKHFSDFDAETVLKRGKMSGEKGELFETVCCFSKIKGSTVLITINEAKRLIKRVFLSNIVSDKRPCNNSAYFG